MAKRYAILIASGWFPDETKLDALRCPENDVSGLDDILSSEDYGHFTQTFVFKNKPHYEIQLAMNQVLRQAAKDDLVLIYYSGHGKLSVPPHNRLYLTAANTVLSALEATSIPVDQIKTYMDISPSKKKVLILDCCFSGAVAKIFTRGGVDDQLQLMSEGQGTCIMTASTGIQAAVEKETDEYGVFTKHIIEGIRTGKADFNRDGLITTDELYQYVHDRVCDEGCQEPMKWDLNVRGELVISRSGKGVDRVREMLLDLARNGFLPDQALTQSLTMISSDLKMLRGKQVSYMRLLDRLSDKRLTPFDFAIEWHRLSESDEDELPVGPKKPVRKTPEKTAIRPVSEVKKVTARPVEKKPDIEPEREREISNSLSMKFVYIEPGTFMMGSPEDEPGRAKNETLHRVTLTRGFYMQVTQVTLGQWQSLMGNNPSHFKSCGENGPVETVSWNDVQVFIKKLNEKEKVSLYRLPTEAEWEYACRAGTQGRYYSGDAEDDLDRAGWYEGNSDGQPHPVGEKEPNAFGLYDMHGNVWEWCRDWYGGYPSGSVTDPSGPGRAADRVLRGGSWYDSAGDCRSGSRYGRGPSDPGNFMGFRLALSPGQQL